MDWPIDDLSDGLKLGLILFGLKIKNWVGFTWKQY
jgi:hypothetical protein